MRAVLHLAIKDVRLLIRDRLGAFFTFLFPILYALLFGLMFSGVGSGPAAVPVAVVDQDGSPGARAFVAALATSEAIGVTEVRSEVEAIELVRRGKSAATLVIPLGTGDPAAGLLAGEPLRLRATTDPSRAAEIAVLRGTMQSLLLQHLTDRLGDAEYAAATLDEARSRLATSPEPDAFLLGVIEGLGQWVRQTGGVEGLAFERGMVVLDATDLSPRDQRVPASAFSVTFAQGAAWGLMACALGSSLSLVGERSNGSLVRLTLAPVRRWHILAGKALGCFLTSMLMLTVLALFVHLPMFGVRAASYPMLLLAMVCCCAAFVGVMMVIAVSGRSVAAVEGFGRAVLLVLALAGGAAVPVLFMPEWMRSIAGLSPFRWAIEAIDGAVWRGFGPAEMALPCAVLLGIGALGFTIGAVKFQLSRISAS
ncbi:MAG: ABC transporter permease [Phycisphaerales bacterium]